MLPNSERVLAGRGRRAVMRRLRLAVGISPVPMGIVRGRVPGRRRCGHLLEQSDRDRRRRQLQRYRRLGRHAHRAGVACQARPAIKARALRLGEHHWAQRSELLQRNEEEHVGRSGSVRICALRNSSIAGPICRPPSTACATRSTSRLRPIRSSSLRSARWRCSGARSTSRIPPSASMSPSSLTPTGTPPRPIPRR